MSKCFCVMCRSVFASFVMCHHDFVSSCVCAICHVSKCFCVTCHMSSSVCVTCQVSSCFCVTCHHDFVLSLVRRHVFTLFGSTYAKLIETVLRPAINIHVGAIGNNLWQEIISKHDPNYLKHINAISFVIVL